MICYLQRTNKKACNQTRNSDRESVSIQKLSQKRSEKFEINNNEAKGPQSWLLTD